MQVYELALELGISSTELAERAAALGMVGLTAASMLSPQQVAALRYEVRGAVPPTPQAWAQPQVGWSQPQPGWAPPPQPQAWAPAPAPAPGWSAEGPRPGAGGFSRGQIVALVAVVATVAVLFGAMAVGTSRRSRREDAAPATTEPSGGSTSTTTSAPQHLPKGAGVGSADLKAHLPATRVLDPLADSRPIPTTWHQAEVIGMDAGSGEVLGGACLDGHEPHAVATRESMLEDVAGGNHGMAYVTIRSFDSPAEATAWVEAHRTAAFQACAKTLSRRNLIAMTRTPKVTDEQLRRIASGGHGLATRYQAGYTTPSGRPCTWYEDVYVEAHGPYTATGYFAACEVPFPAQGERDAMTALEGAMAQLGTA